VTPTPRYKEIANLLTKYPFILMRKNGIHASTDKLFHWKMFVDPKNMSYQTEQPPTALAPSKRKFFFFWKRHNKKTNRSTPTPTIHI